MNEDKLIPVVVKNKRSLSKLGDVSVYLTQKLKSQLEGEKTKTDENLFTLFGRGMALRGFKHLVEKIREKEPKVKIIFTHKPTGKSNDQISINYDGYKKSTQEKFFALYRATGLDAASYFLNLHFPQDFSYDKPLISESDIKKLDKSFPQIIQQIPKKRKNQKAIIEQTSSIITELLVKKRLLRQEIDDLEKLRNQSNIFYFQTKLEELTTRLSRSHHETRGKDSWQSWIYENNWLFGVNYQPPIEKQKINIAGSMPDYLFPTLDGFLDILEIKLPSMEVIVKDPDHTGAYAWSGNTNKAIGQVVTYLNDIELYQLHLKQAIKRVYSLDIYLIKPRAFILIGKKDGWSEDQHQALRKLNYSLHGIEVITYSDLKDRGQEILDKYTKNLSAQSKKIPKNELH